MAIDLCVNIYMVFFSVPLDFFLFFLCTASLKLAPCILGPAHMSSQNSQGWVKFHCQNRGQS